MTKRSKVQLYEQIRRVHEREKLSIRALARRFGVHRREVRAALEELVKASPCVDSRPQLLMTLAGEGGTGKSRTLEAVHAFANALAKLPPWLAMSCAIS